MDVQVCDRTSAITNIHHTQSTCAHRTQTCCFTTLPSAHNTQAPHIICIIAVTTALDHLINAQATTDCHKLLLHDMAWFHLQ
jgi:hypothetical protein